MANKTATIHLRIEPDLKSEAASIFKSLGLTTTDAIKIFLHQAVITGGLPFPVITGKPNEATIRAILEADLIDKKILKSDTISVDEFFKGFVDE